MNPFHQTEFDWLLGHPLKHSYRVQEVARILGLSKDTVVGLIESGQLWGHDHERLRGEGIRKVQVVTRDSLACYLADTANSDPLMKLERVTEAAKSLRRSDILTLYKTLKKELNL